MCKICGEKNNTHCVYTCRTTTSMNIIIVWVLSKQRALSSSSNPSLWARSEVIPLWPDKARGIPGTRGFSATFLLWASASDCLPLLCNTLQIRRTGELQNNKSFQISCNPHKRPSDIVWNFECCNMNDGLSDWLVQLWAGDHVFKGILGSGMGWMQWNAKIKCKNSITLD